MNTNDFKIADARFKDNRKPIKKVLELLEEIDGYQFIWNSGQNTFKGNDFGFLGQDLEKILPDIVKKDNDGIYHIKYTSLVAILWEQNKQLLKRIEELESKIK